MPVSWIVFHLTDRCQLACRHCLRDPARQATDLPIPLLERVLDQAVAHHRSRHVAFTGGEPTLHPRFDGAVDAVVRRNLGWHFVTSGRGFERVLALLEADPRRRAGLTAIDLSVDGADAATHEAIRGEGTWREVMQAVVACEARAIPFSLQMTVNAVNAHQIEPFALMAAQLGAGRVSFGMTQATGSDFDARLWMGIGAWREARDRIGRIQSLLRIPVVAHEGFQLDQPFHACEPFRSEMLHVDARGRLTLCCQHAGVPGGEADVIADLATTSLLEAHRRLLDLVHRAQRDKLDAIERGELGAWDLFPCNHCLRRFGKPHWTEAGAAGPAASRARQRGGDR